jgi:hypothetical protein
VVGRNARSARLSEPTQRLPRSACGER